MSVRSLWYSLDYPFTSPGIRRPALQVYIREWLMWQFLSLGLFSWLSTMLPPQLNLTSNGGWNLHSWRLFSVSYCVIGLCILSVHDLSCFWRACVHLSIIFSRLFSPFSSYRPWCFPILPCSILAPPKRLRLSTLPLQPTIVSTMTCLIMDMFCPLPLLKAIHTILLSFGYADYRILLWLASRPVAFFHSLYGEVAWYTRDCSSLTAAGTCIFQHPGIWHFIY